MNNVKKFRSSIPASVEGRLFERPDGFYWQSKDNVREYGPFATLLAALNDMELDAVPCADEELLEVVESLAEAESEVGIAGWLDPDSGEISEEERPRIEEH